VLLSVNTGGQHIGRALTRSVKRGGLGPPSVTNQRVRRAEQPHVMFLYNTRYGLVSVGYTDTSMLLITATKDKLKHALGTSPKSPEVRHNKRQERQMLVFPGA
jgi:hypothetical protein